MNHKYSSERRENSFNYFLLPVWPKTELYSKNKQSFGFFLFEYLDAVYQFRILFLFFSFSLTVNEMFTIILLRFVCSQSVVKVMFFFSILFKNILENMNEMDLNTQTLVCQIKMLNTALEWNTANYIHANGMTKEVTKTKQNYWNLWIWKKKLGIVHKMKKWSTTQ